MAQLVHKAAWIGLGNMGVPMVKNLAENTAEVAAYNRTQNAYGDIGKAVWTDSLSVAVRNADVVFVMVSDGHAVNEVLFAETGVVTYASRGTIVVNMSTIGVDETKEIAGRLAEQGLLFMDAPVSGSVKPAQDGSLVILAGGSQDVFDRVRPSLESMGKDVFHLGGIGSGAAMKLLMNSFLGLLMEAAGECMGIADKAGLTRESFLQVLSKTGMWAPILKLKQPAWEQAEFPAAFALKHMTKDLGLASSFAQEISVSAPALMSAMAMFVAAREEGYGEQDMAAVSEYIKELSKD
ncbi:NAD(P)-dependent oxidoreductase [Alicyclobacillus sp. SO9]|uniref:NAD(P)-dependent oxidoreductase n=1 Tax=Alicyclobacillus sp. SO9 TaxID=2665646 RepID=UPI0018E793DF|nr:NAD(P)-dependent oxidoreductase [Alicyclobacillus sp. SO9]QQE77054.1 NAD(P)-dependent oxidoreductase [Alicyclobacillus sp. SO9]